MSWQATSYVLVLFLATASSLVLAGYSWYLYRYRRNEAYIVAFFVLCSAVAIWSFFYALQISRTDFETTLAMYKLLHIGGATVPPAWFVFSLLYSGRSRLVTPRTVGLVAAIPLVFLLAIPTNPYSVVLTDATLEAGHSHTVLVTENGPLYLLFLAYAYVLLIVGSVVIATDAVQSGPRYRKQSALLVGGAFVPLLLNVLTVFAVPPFGDLDVNLTPISLSVSVLLFGIAIFHYDLFDRTPIARTEVFETMDEGVIVLDEDASVVDVNPAADRLLEPASRPIGKPINDVMPQYNELEQAENDVIELRGRENSEPRLVQVTRTPLTNGEVEGWVVLLKDVTALETQRQELQKQNNRLDTFASTIAHDLRNPLFVMEGYTDLARESGEDEYFEKIKDSIEQIDQFLEDLLLLSRQGRTIEERRTLSLPQICEQAYPENMEDTVTRQIETEATLKGDPQRLKQAMNNLFRNAVHHGGDDVTIRIGELPNGFYVEDDGPGIPPEHREKVFDPGFTTESDGTGFGLAIVHDIITAHGWEINVTDGIDGGARFEILTD